MGIVFYTIEMKSHSKVENTVKNLIEMHWSVYFGIPKTKYKQFQ